VAATLLALPIHAQTPPLPSLSLGEYPDEARAAVAPAYDAAVRQPMDAVVVGALGRTLQAWLEFDAAHQTYLRAQSLAETVFDWPYLDAVVLQRLARHDEAAGQLRRALKLTPDYLPAQVRLADSLMRSGNLDDSEPLFLALVASQFAEPFGRFGLGQIAAARGRPDVAVTHFSRALAIIPEWGEVHYALAMAYRALNRRDDALRALAAHARFAAIVPALEDPVLASTAQLRDDAVASLQRGVKLKEAGDLQGAIAAHEAAVARQPDYAQAHANLISLYTDARNWIKVEEHFHAVRSLGFGLADANFDYGVALERQEKWNLAEAAYRRAVAINPAHAAAHINLGRALERRNELEQAAAEFRLAVASQPTNRVARYDLGRMLLALGQPREAVTEFEKALEPRDEQTPSSLLGLAVAHAVAGQPKEATRRFTEARDLAASYGLTDVVRAIDEARAKFGEKQP
jgi:tetratricopeptide (TPR) repeat protein